MSRTADAWSAEELEYSFEEDTYCLVCPACDLATVLVSRLLSEGWASCMSCGAEYSARIYREDVAVADGGQGRDPANVAGPEAEDRP